MTDATATAPVPPYYLLGSTDEERDFELYQLSRAFYKRVRGDMELFQYFAAVLLRGNRRERASLPVGVDYDQLEEKLAMTLGYALGKPLPDGASLDLTFHLTKLNVSPDHNWKTLYHALAACEDRGYPLAVIKIVTNVWVDVTPQLVRRHAGKPA